MWFVKPEKVVDNISITAWPHASATLYLRVWGYKETLCEISRNGSSWEVENLANLANINISLTQKVLRFRNKKKWNCQVIYLYSVRKEAYLDLLFAVCINRTFTALNNNNTNPLGVSSLRPQTEPRCLRKWELLLPWIRNAKRGFSSACVSTSRSKCTLLNI